MKMENSYSTSENAEFLLTMILFFGRRKAATEMHLRCRSKIHINAPGNAHSPSL